MIRTFKNGTHVIASISIILLITLACSVFARSAPEWAKVLNLGATFSVYSYGQAPYNRSAPFLNLDERTQFSNGSEAFNRHRPSTADASSGVAPTLGANATSCEICHFKNGRGRSHSPNFDLSGFSVPPSQDNRSISKVVRLPSALEPKVSLLSNVRWEVVDRVELTGGEVVELVKPSSVIDGAVQPADLRNASGVYGLGLLEAISDASIIGFAQSTPFSDYGVKGVVSRVTIAPGLERVGRFGWKATHATLESQVRSAVKNEMGIVPVMQPNDIENREFSLLIEELTDYMRLLAVPARRLNDDKPSLTGAALFADIGCAMCHRPSWHTSSASSIEQKYRNLRIYPFTDLLLHDMGAALADPSGNELSRYWRTAPLWGLGVQHGVDGGAGFLHDGRARTISEAILWHGGESDYAVKKFLAMTPNDRENLLTFLASL